MRTIETITGFGITLNPWWNEWFDERVKKVKRSHYRPGVAQRLGRGIALLFHDRGTRRGGELSAACPGRTLPPGTTLYPFYRRLGWPQGRSERAENSRPHRDSIPDRPARSSVAIPTELPGPHDARVGERILLAFVIKLRRQYKWWMKI